MLGHTSAEFGTIKYLNIIIKWIFTKIIMQNNN